MLSSSGAAAQASMLSSLAAADSARHGFGGAGLSRSRSAQPPASSKFMSPTVAAVPRSALPNQTFRIPPTPSRVGYRLRTDDSIVEGS